MLTETPPSTLTQRHIQRRFLRRVVTARPSRTHRCRHHRLRPHPLPGFPQARRQVLELAVLLAPSPLLSCHIHDSPQAQGQEEGGPKLPVLPANNRTQPAQPEPSLPGFSALSGFKAELPADGPPSASTIASPSIPNSPSPRPIASSIGDFAPIPTVPPGAYGNNRHSNVSQLSSGTQGYSESLLSTLTPQAPEEPRTSAAGRGHPKISQHDTIYELQG